MTAALFEKGLAFLGALLVGVTAIVQLKNEWKSHGLDATVTKVLLGLMVFGCVLAFLAAINVLGGGT